MNAAFNPFSNGQLCFVQEKKMICKAMVMFAIASATSQAIVMGSNAVLNLKLFPFTSYCKNEEHNHSMKWINALIFGGPFFCTLLGTFYYDIKSLHLGKSNISYDNFQWDNVP